MEITMVVFSRKEAERISDIPFSLFLLAIC